MILDHGILIKDRNEKDFYFVEFQAPDYLKCRLVNVTHGQNSSLLGLLHVNNLSIEELQKIKVWDQLSEEIKKGIENFEVTDKNSIRDRMGKARASRQLKYPNVPKTVTCIECGNVQNMAAGIIVKKAEKWALDNELIPNVEKWIAQWKCNKCSGVKRGRKPSHNLPPKIELKCKCGASVIYPALLLLNLRRRRG